METRYVVAIVGGATAGAETAGLLAARGVVSVVFEQNPRPYGKIEDGLPRWHAKLREKEYATIDAHLDRPQVHFVPNTRVGRDVDFRELVDGWGFTAVILAHGAWKDRPLPVPGADAYVGRGLVYQNTFIYWFNHCEERGYAGPRYDAQPGTVVVGGGLASIDVCKVLQIEVVRRALRQRGIEASALEMEHAGIPAVLATHGLTWQGLGLRPAALFYRRQVEDMPLLEMPADADTARRQQVGAVRRRLVEKAMNRYCFTVEPLRAPLGVLVERDRVVGMRFQRTTVTDGQLLSIPGAVDDVRAPLVISSIGSIPEPLAGIPQRGELYDFVDRELGRLRGYDTVFSTGNVVTGKGNVAASRRHSVEMTARLLEGFLGVAEDDGHAGEDELLDGVTAPAAAAAARMAEWVGSRPPVAPVQVARILQRVHERQATVGYTGSYRDWIARVTPVTAGG